MFQSCREACQAIACDGCAEACLSEPDVMMMAAEHPARPRLRQNRLHGRIVHGFQQPSAADVCQLCAHICEACAAECEKHDHDYCKACAEACRRCAGECRKMAKGAHAMAV